MGSIISGIIRGFSSFLTVGILSGICLVWGFSPNQWFADLFTNPPIWITSIWTRIGVVFLGALFGWWTYKLFQSWRSNNKKDDVITKTIPLPIVQPPRKHDVWLTDAAHYLVTKDWGISSLEINDKNLSDLDDAENEIRQHACDGDLLIWGTNNFAGPLILIDKEYWEKYGFDMLGVILEPSEWKTENKLRPHNQSIYHSLKTSKAKVEELWPSKSQEVSFREKIRRIRDLYAGGVELRNNAASLRIIDVETERKMNEIREKLTKDMDELSPAQAINLHTINTFDPGNHPPMILQDPKSTLIFSEFLARVQKILEGIK